MARTAALPDSVPKRSSTMDMTEGSILSLLLKFAFPLMIGNLFQQLYNMVDTWVIGQTGNNSAYAAVGSVGPVINILIGFYSGFATGAGVVISQYFGKKDYNRVRSAVHTTVSAALILCLIFTVLGVCFTPWILRMMLGEEAGEVYTFAKGYLTIYFAGVTGLLIYNVGSGILRAVGDSRHPFYFLAVAACLNIVLDFVFVFGFNMSVSGVALATVISQAVSAALTLLTLLRTEMPVRISPRLLKIEPKMLGSICLIGLPAAVQTALTAFANVFVQGYIAGADGIQELNLSGYTTYSKIDHFLFLPAQSISLSVSTFVGQNIGVGNERRAKRGAFIGIAAALVAISVLIVLILLFAPALASIFNSDPAVVEIASSLLRLITPFYLLTAINQNLAAYLRGTGNSIIPMITMLSCFVGVRQIYLFVCSRYFSNALLPLVTAFPVGWVCCAIAISICFLLSKPKRLIDKETQTPEKTA